MKYISLLLLLPSVLLAQGAGPVNPLLDQFLKKGVEIPGIPPVKLREPMLHERMNANELAMALELARGTIPLDIFVRKDGSIIKKVEALNDPKDKKDADGRVFRHGQKITVRFVAHGKLATVLQKDMLNQLIGGAKAKGRILQNAELAKRDIKPLARKGVQERYAELDMRVLDTVLVSGITRNVTTSQQKSAYMTTILEDRFAKDAEFPNIWRPIDVQGKLGKPRPYTGLAGYAFVMELPQPAGALYLEMHYIMHEPFAWFEGKDLLRAKLPIVIDDNVKNFRRALK